ncbi:hypothetical protein V1478_007668 [Vespula squamosa]|uniref:Uncharacterized protein n=1 Tax=Vespula squamosa TaxID=30214 RepID=A0ABD2B1A6_VESSQ
MSKTQNANDLKKLVGKVTKSGKIVMTIKGFTPKYLLEGEQTRILPKELKQEKTERPEEEQKTNAPQLLSEEEREAMCEACDVPEE